ncbi:conserved hypothetical protein [Methanolacinia petrolearia DSM 11571]|uniref:Uncharacterized protein n=1 Tax=Methanolacinia petrolearia (strain DSM 11571 / OCM 486 / SEBR 4847) TaxID=679926 RepID=E1RD79_METP4|nr:hypothetical protein [Methanolacinia petrolearia]ADN37062.1 conserved hypothetical protein [Methanolacinia petrolearia DSM 11571]
MMRTKRTLTDDFTLTNKTVEIPTTAVVDKFLIHNTIVVENSSDDTAYSGTIAAILEKMSEIRLVSDSNNVHYQLSGLDVAIMNWYDEHGVGVNPDTAVSIPAGGSETFTFMLTLDKGDIIAVGKQSLDLSVSVGTSIATDVAITSYTGKVTLEEVIMTEAEILSVYGQGLVGSAEPKVTTVSKPFDATSDLHSFLNLPTGTALRQSYISVLDTSGVRGTVTPSEVGIIKEVPNRQDMFSCHFTTLRETNKRSFDVANLLNGIAIIDYGREITNDAFGVKGWTFKPGDVRLATKSETAGKVRVINVEYVVNTAAYNAAVIEAA